jgi:hypothetical protein
MKLVRLFEMCLAEISSKVHTGKLLCGVWSEKIRCFKPLFFNFTLEYATRKVQENLERLELHGTHQYLTIVNGVDLMGENINTTNKNTETLIIDAS